MTEREQHRAERGRNPGKKRGTSRDEAAPINENEQLGTEAPLQSEDFLTGELADLKPGLENEDPEVAQENWNDFVQLSGEYLAAYNQIRDEKYDEQHAKALKAYGSESKAQAAAKLHIENPNVQEKIKKEAHKDVSARIHELAPKFVDSEKYNDPDIAYGKAYEALESGVENMPVEVIAAAHRPAVEAEEAPLTAEAVTTADVAEEQKDFSQLSRAEQRELLNKAHKETKDARLAQEKQAGKDDRKAEQAAEKYANSQEGREVAIARAQELAVEDDSEAENTPVVEATEEASAPTESTEVSEEAAEAQGVEKVAEKHDAYKNKDGSWTKLADTRSRLAELSYDARQGKLFGKKKLEKRLQEAQAEYEKESQAYLEREIAEMDENLSEEEKAEYITKLYAREQGRLQGEEANNYLEKENSLLKRSLEWYNSKGWKTRAVIGVGVGAVVLSGAGAVAGGAAAGAIIGAGRLGRGYLNMEAGRKGGKMRKSYQNDHEKGKLLKPDERSLNEKGNVDVNNRANLREGEMTGEEAAEWYGDVTLRSFNKEWAQNLKTSLLNGEDSDGIAGVKNGLENYQSALEKESAGKRRSAKWAVGGAAIGGSAVYLVDAFTELGDGARHPQADRAIEGVQNWWNEQGREMYENGRDSAGDAAQNAGDAVGDAANAVTGGESSANAAEFFSGEAGTTEFSEAGVEDMSAWLDGYEVQQGDTIWNLSDEYLQAHGVENPSVEQIDAVKDQMVPELQGLGHADQKGWIYTGDVLDTDMDSTTGEAAPAESSPADTDSGSEAGSAEGGSNNAAEAEGGSEASQYFSGEGSATEFIEAGVDDMKDWLNGYEVQQGDSVWSLSERYLEANGIQDPSIYQTDAVKDQMIPELQEKGYVDERGWLDAGEVLNMEAQGGETADRAEGAAGSVENTPNDGSQQEQQGGDAQQTTSPRGPQGTEGGGALAYAQAGKDSAAYGEDARLPNER